MKFFFDRIIVIHLSWMDSNFWPNGLGANLNELELVLRYTYEQGLVDKRQLKIEEIFHPSTLQLTES